MRKFESSQKDESRTKFLESFQNYLSTLTHHRLIAARLGDSSELSRSILIFRLFAIPASSSVCHVARFVKFSCENFLFPEILVTRYRTTTFTAEKRSGSSPPLRADNIALNFRHVTQCASHRNLRCFICGSLWSETRPQRSRSVTSVKVRKCFYGCEPVKGQTTGFGEQRSEMSFQSFCNIDLVRKSFSGFFQSSSYSLRVFLSNTNWTHSPVLAIRCRCRSASLSTVCFRSKSCQGVIVTEASIARQVFRPTFDTTEATSCTCWWGQPQR